MTTTDMILGLLTTQARTRHELQAATGFSLPTLESALTRLKKRRQITAQRLAPQPAIRRPGIYGRPPRPSVSYALLQVTG